jgi:hypothetical protein
MNAPGPRWRTALVALLAVAALPVLGHWLRRPPGERCALDGVGVEPLFRVRVLDGRGRWAQFCCVRCAEVWLRRQGERPAGVHVTDEASGEEVDAAAAWFVRSRVVTNPVTGNRVHAFRDPDDARRHAEACGGVLLSGAERPFQAED